MKTSYGREDTVLKTKLKPYVHKVKGAKNYGLYDILNGIFYTLKPEGDVETLKKSLSEAGLTLETEGTVPLPITISMPPERDLIRIRELQIRVNGSAETDCLNRVKKGGIKRYISQECLSQIKQEITDIPLKIVRIEAETMESEKIALILEEFSYEKAIVFIEEGITDDFKNKAQHICDSRDTQLVINNDGNRENEIKELKINAYDFVYHHRFNPCLGQQVAIDCGGEIKPCLWINISLGTVGCDNLKDIIISGIFDEYWGLTKDKILVCKDCESRYACNDCRVAANNIAGNEWNDGKPAYCSYDPY
jgi:hypothetical protein